MMAPSSFENDGHGPHSTVSLLSRLQTSLGRLFSAYLDRTILYPRARWCFFVIILSLFLLRVYILQGFFVVTYALGIYLLNLFIGFLSPQADPETEAYVLPVRETEEYRPFQRKLPEYKFWLQGSKATLLSCFATIFPILDLPVFWPILLIYFIMLSFVTLRQQVKHMIQHKYIPFSWGKQTYGDITRNSGSKKRYNPFGKKGGTAVFPSAHVKQSSHIS